ncbi:MAG: AraC family transcriptional regulator [Eubacteriales bacterium]|nr:AraC family transcriptional regulator [Eubacteriales bacterium]
MEYYQITELERPLKITGMYSFHYFEYVKDFEGNGEKHNFWEFVYVDYGTVKVCSDDDCYTVGVGEGFLHRPNEWHNIFTESEYASTIIFSFGCEDQHLEYLCKKVLKVYGAARRSLEMMFQLGANTFTGPLDIFDLQKLEIGDRVPYGMEQLIVSYLEIFLLSMIQNEMGAILSPAVKRYQRERNENVDKIVEILNRHLYDRVSMEDICRESGFSKSYLSKIFKNTMNMGVMDYYNRMKIKEAERMISEKTYTFTEIAEKLNFGSVHYFSKFFKQITNMTPSGYRNSMKHKLTL